MRAEIISVGTELLLGQIIDTNAAYLGEHLAEVGIDVHFRQTVGDNPARIGEVLHQAIDRADLIVMTGGLGPTEDDLTVATVAEVLGLDLVYHEGSAKHIRRFFEIRGRTPPASVYKQAMIPRGAHAIPNTRGTAPGVHLEHRGITILIMPGVPFEMKGMMEQYVVPLLRQRPGVTVIRSRVLRVTGEGESAVEERIRDLVHGTNPTIAPYAKLGEVHLRMTAKGTPDEVAAALDRGDAQVRERLGDLVYGVDTQSLEGVVASLLVASGLTVAVAESCTGGLIAERLTNVPGSSAYFLEGIVAYSNAAKERVLGVDHALLERHGAVSAPVAKAMARGVRAKSGAAIGLAVTGIAGPTGGTPEKPIGLVVLAMADDAGALHRRVMFGTEAGRAGIRHLASQAALNLLRLHLLKR